MEVKKLMELRVLRYFLTVVHEENITRAADILHITQPTLSRQLAAMEEELGVRLFDRGSRRIVLTEEGMLLRRRAEEIISLADKTEQELAVQGASLEGKITIGAGESASMQQLAACCDAFQTRYPLVTFDLLTAAADVVQEQMDKGLIDVGLLIEPVDMSKYDYIRMEVKEEWGVFMRSEDPLAQETGISADVLAQLPLILPRRLSMQSELANWFGGAYSQLNIRFTSNLSTNSCIMVRKRLGYALAIRGSMPFLDGRHLAFVPLSPALRATSVLAWKRQQPFSPAATRFIEFSKCFLGMEKPNSISIGHMHAPVL